MLMKWTALINLLTRSFLQINEVLLMQILMNSSSTCREMRLRSLIALVLHESLKVCKERFKSSITFLQTTSSRESQEIAIISQQWLHLQSFPTEFSHVLLQQNLTQKANTKSDSMMMECFEKLWLTIISQAEKVSSTSLELMSSKKFGSNFLKKLGPRFADHTLRRSEDQSLNL